MSDLNATPVEPVPEGIIAENEVIASETSSATTSGEQPTGSTVTSNQLPGTPVTPTYETRTYSDGTVATGIAPLPELSPAEQDVTDCAVESAPVAPADVVAGFPVDFSQALHDLLLYIHEAFETVSLAEGLSRFYEIAKAVKARAEA